MASVLSREIDAYKRAVEQYNRQTKGYNRGINAYNQTLLTDPNGNTLVRDAAGNVYAVEAGTGKLLGGMLPDGKSVADYGTTPIEGSNAYMVMRQNPTQRNTEQVSGVVMQSSGEGNTGGYYIPSNEGAGQMLGPEWRKVSEQGPTTEGGNTTYTFERDASTYMDRPGAFSGKAPKSPNPSMSQVRKMFTPSMAQQERGLVSNVIASHGLATGGTPVAYRSGSVIQQPTQPGQPGSPGPGVIDSDSDPNNFTYIP